MSDGPFWSRQSELELYTPLVGDTMLELGNKKNRGFTYKQYFEDRGYKHVSVDINGKDGALPYDLTEPMDIGTFDMVSNIGTTEHVGVSWEGQEQCWKNILNAMHVGSVLVSTTPYPGHWKWHGTWYPFDTFFLTLATENGMRVDRLYIHPHHKGDMLYVRLLRVKDQSVPIIRPCNFLENEID